MKWAIVVALIVGATLGYLFYFADRGQVAGPVATTTTPAEGVEVKLGSVTIPLDNWQASTTTETSQINVKLEDPGARRDQVLAFVNRTLHGYEESFDPATMPANELAWIRESGRPYVLTVEGRASAGTDGRTSYRLSAYADTGGAHPNGAISAETYGPDGARLMLADVVGADRTLERLAEAVRPRLAAAIRERVGGDEPYEPDEDFEAGTDPTIENYASWYLQGDSVVVVFNQYQVGPYTFGTYEIAVPLGELRV
jgi:hypothetical protein